MACPPSSNSGSSCLAKLIVPPYRLVYRRITFAQIWKLFYFGEGIMPTCRWYPKPLRSWKITSPVARPLICSKFSIATFPQYLVLLGWCSTPWHTDRFLGSNHICWKLTSLFEMSSFCAAGYFSISPMAWKMMVFEVSSPSGTSKWWYVSMTPHSIELQFSELRMREFSVLVEFSAVATSFSFS